MSLRRGSIVQQQETGARDADCKDGSSCSSRQSSPSRSIDYSSCWEPSEGSISPVWDITYEYEHDGDHSVIKTSIRSPDKKQGSKTLKAQTEKKGRQHHPKQSHAANGKVFPPIKCREGPNQRIRSAYGREIKELRSQVHELQQQLSDAATENRLLKQLQSRHMVALQHLQDSQNSRPQHNKEVRALQESLREARQHRNSLARRLQATEQELLLTKDSLQHLQRLSQDHSLGEREALGRGLALATDKLERKTRRIQDMERNLELSQASFNRQIANEKRKTYEAQEMCAYLEECNNQLTKRIKEQERELEINNIYSHRFPKSCNKKVGLRESKAVQTDAVSPLPCEVPTCPLELEYPNTETELDIQRSLEPFTIDDTDTEETTADQSGDDEGAQDNEDSADEQDDGSEKEKLQPPKGDGYRAEEKADIPQALEGEQTEECDNQVRSPPQDFLNTEPLTNKALKSHSWTKSHYTFTETIQNLHSGKPAYSTHSRSPEKHIKSQARFENLGGRGEYEPSITLPAGMGLRKDTPWPKEPLANSKKSSSIKELFGGGQITDSLPMQTGRSKGQSSNLDSGSSYHMGDVNPI